jgi:hypothetical protein
VKTGGYFLERRRLRREILPPTVTILYDIIHTDMEFLRKHIVGHDELIRFCFVLTERVHSMKNVCVRSSN